MTKDVPKILLEASEILDKTTAMATLIQNVPNSYNWGFFSREDPRMHLQNLTMERDLKFKVWLEEKGKRIFEPSTPWPAKVKNALRSYLDSKENRSWVERYWIGLMIKQGWLTFSYSAPIVTLIAYPKLPHQFIREIDIRLDAPYEPDFLAINRNNIKLVPEKCSMVLLSDRSPEEQIDVPLEKFIFVD